SASADSEAEDSSETAATGTAGEAAAGPGGTGSSGDDAGSSAHDAAWFVSPVGAGTGTTGSDPGTHSRTGRRGECGCARNARYLADRCLPDECADDSCGGNARAAAAKAGTAPVPSSLPCPGVVHRRRQAGADCFLDRGRPCGGLRRSLADLRRLVERRRMGPPGMGCGDPESERVAGRAGLSGGPVVRGGEL